MIGTPSLKSFVAFSDGVFFFCVSLSVPRKRCVTSPVTNLLILFTLKVAILLHIKNCLDLSFNLYENLPPEVKI